MSPANYAKAIEAYEATLNTPALFDRYLSGQNDALNDEQKSGTAAFHENWLRRLPFWKIAWR